MSGSRRTAVVSGGVRGIGAAIARRLAADGCSVAILDLDGDGALALADELRAEGTPSIGLLVNVTDGTQVQSGMNEVAKSLGPQTVLVSNAEVLRDILMLRMLTDDWDAVARGTPRMWLTRSRSSPMSARASSPGKCSMSRADRAVD